MMHGTAEGDTFKEACDNFAAANPEFARYYNAEYMTYWACRLFDNKRDAGRAYG